MADVIIIDSKLKEEKDYWLKRLAGMVVATTLDPDLHMVGARFASDDTPPLPDGVVERRRGRLDYCFDTTLTAHLHRLTGPSPFLTYTLLVSGLKVCLRRYTGAAEVVVGSPPLAECRHANALVIVDEVRDGESFRDLALRVRRNLLEAYANQRYPYHRLIKELGVAGGEADEDQSLKGSVLFDVAVELEGFHGRLAEAGESLRLRFKEQATEPDAEGSATSESKALVVSIDYDEQRYSRDLITRFIIHCQEILRAAVADASRRVGDLEMMSADELRLLLVEWNRTGSPYPQDRSIHELFAEQAARTSERIALVGAGRQVSYKELNRRANQLGRYLQGLGVGPEVVVGVCLERSVEMVVALLGALKAGGAYLPLDPEYPPDRLSHMLKDAGVETVLTLRESKERLPSFGGRTVCLDEEWEKIGAESEREPESDVVAGNLAYVIYTSGSTGRPKGVMVEHRGLCNLVEAQKEAFGLGGIGERSRVLQFASLSFDASVSEIFSALTAGESLSLYSRESLMPGDDLSQVLREDQITTVTLPPTVLAALGQEELPGLHTLIVAGEACSAELVERWARGRRFLDAYGPTEATVCASIGELKAGGQRRPTIGRPIANTRLYILDRETAPAPVGVRGELYIAGIGVARGYWGSPERTAERFLPDLFSRDGGERLYRTGDVVRYSLNGEIEFIGRADDQVKVRGYRIELGEIETIVRKHPGVSDAVVILRGDEADEKRLVAYIAGEKNQRPTSGELREHLRKWLPEYMVPALWVELDELPMTPSGKVDRRALPAPDTGRADFDSRFAAARTPVEEIVSGIWAEVLRLEKVGAEENFFDLGGHSLLATQVVSRIKASFAVELPLRVIFARPTVTSLAQSIEEARREKAGLSAPPLGRASREGPLPLSFAQQRLWFLDQLEPNSSLYNLPLALRLRGELQPEALRRTLTEIVRRHEALRTRFEAVNGTPAQIITPPMEAMWSVFDLSGEAPEEREREVLRLASEEARRPFDLARVPLWRASLLRLGENEHVVLFTMSHIVSDGWSMGVLVREVAALYAAYLRGEDSPLPELPIQYADYAVWQREWLQGEILAQQMDYWRKRLEGAPGEIELPTDRPRPVVETHVGGSCAFRLEPDLSGALKALSRGEGVTLFMTLLAAFKALLSRYSGQSDLVVGTPIANRARPEIEGLMGFFINQLVLRTDLSGEPSFRQLLGRVREVCLGAYGRQDVPFEKLVEELQPERDLSRTPLFQVMIVLQNAPMGELELPGLQLSEITYTGAGEMVKFNLTLTMVESKTGIDGALEYNADLFDQSTITRLIRHFEQLLSGAAANAEQKVYELPLLSEREREQILEEWNRTEADYPERCIHTLFEEQAQRTPDVVALVDGEQVVSYGELNRRANRLARHLLRLGVGPESPIGLCLRRSVEMVMGMLAILKAGGAYLPLDTEYPPERLCFMLEDAGVPFLLTRSGLSNIFAGYSNRMICLDTSEQEISYEDNSEPLSAAVAENAAYVIYTSGSTGAPKGVLVTHHNVASFFTAMDACFYDQTPGDWLAMTGISFDISVLELLWTLTRGFRVIIQREIYGTTAFQTSRETVSPEIVGKEMEFSLFYFASEDAGSTRNRYRLLMEGARFADQHGFTAVWTPERHFHSFGGLYPNPSVTSAAVAAITERIQIRAGSVVLPLHNPLRVAEEWAVVDNISNGRVGISFASGWQADDFVLAPERYLNRKEIMLDEIETVRQLWRGAKISAWGGAGNELGVAIHPRPIQPELPVWLTAAGNPETFRLAGEMGANVLTHLVGQSIEALENKIQIYRDAWRNRGQDPGAGRVTLMLHTFVGSDINEVKEKVRAPFCNYLKSSVDLIRNFARSIGRDADELTEDDLDVLLAQSFDRYFTNSGLLGTPDTCLKMIERLKNAGVDEIACLIDFGVDEDEVISSLSYLNQVKELHQRKSLEVNSDVSISEIVKRYKVTHLQCTPSMAQLLAHDGELLNDLGSLRRLLLGGEAAPASLVKHLREALPGKFYNMYGPTETTIWSSTHEIDRINGTIPIGRPIANTKIYLLDNYLQPAPIGVPGEIYIGGAGVARGYLDQPDITALRFIPDSYSGKSGTRLYRTGDRARYCPDGALEFLGRLDRQVKLRGYRIEAGEIEAAISRYPGIRNAVVVVREGTSGESKLVAYVEMEQASASASGSGEAQINGRNGYADRKRLRLANGMIVSYVSAAYAHGAYREIFEEETYLRHGIKLQDGDCIFDIGANIGVFTLFVHQRYKDVTVYAVEPIPPIFQVLRANVEMYGVKGKIYQCGIADIEGQDTFTFYPESPGLSGRYSEMESDKQTARALLSRHEAVPREIRESLTQTEMDEFLNSRFRSERYTCQLRTLSDLIVENKIERIDLLKIDVEKSEFDVLAGIREEDWRKIKQLVLEVEGKELLHKITTLLSEVGYEYVIDEALSVAENDEGAGIHVYMVYAARSSEGYLLIADDARPIAGDARPIAGDARLSAGDARPRTVSDLNLSGKNESLAEMIKDFLGKKLPHYMIPSAFVFVDALPMTLNGKIDYRALPTLEASDLNRDSGAARVPPRNEMERLVSSIWQAALQMENIGVYDNFFDLGGHSLLVVRVHSELRQRLQRDVSVVDLFRFPTVESLAKHLNRPANQPLPAHKILRQAEKQRDAIARQKQAVKTRNKRNE